MIEYSAFYGSIKIFRHLILKNVEMNQELFLYAIHQLENNKIFPDFETIQLLAIFS